MGKPNQTPATVSTPAAAIAAEVNAAPPAPAPVQDTAAAEVIAVGAPLEEEEPAANGNPYHTIFEDVRFEISDSDQVYTNDRDGLQSKRIAVAAVIYRGGFAAVPATVYARKPKNGTVYADVTFMGTRQTSAIKPLDEQSKADLLDFRRHLAERFVEWRKTQKAVTVNRRTAAGVPVDGVTF
jgi:hypothetical protein